MTDRKTRLILAVAVLAALFSVLILPMGESGRIAGAIVLVPAAIASVLLLKKRSILSFYKHQVLLIVSVIALLLIMVYYLSGLKFGFYTNPRGLTFANFFKFFLPTAVIILCTEVIRSTFVAQQDKLLTALCYVGCVVADVLIVTNLPSVTSFNRFMDLMAGALLPALISNLLYFYLSKRYGMLPNLSFRAITTLYVYVFHVTSAISDSIVSLFKLIVPVAIYLFIDALYEKKKKYALTKRSPALRAVSIVVSVCALFIMVGTVMLVSNQFQYGALVIATESMTGELNKGDVVIFEDYEAQTVKEGQVIIFEKNGNMVVHRVVDIEIINGIPRYYTQGDANEDPDDGFITDAEIIGVVDCKLPSIGYLTLWMRSLFNR